MALFGKIGEFFEGYETSLLVSTGEIGNLHPYKNTYLVIVCITPSVIAGKQRREREKGNGSGFEAQRLVDVLRHGFMGGEDCWRRFHSCFRQCNTPAKKSKRVSRPF